MAMISRSAQVYYFFFYSWYNLPGSSVLEVLVAAITCRIPLSKEWGFTLPLYVKTLCLWNWTCLFRKFRIHTFKIESEILRSTQKPLLSTCNFRCLGMSFSKQLYFGNSSLILLTQKNIFVSVKWVSLFPWGVIYTKQ